MLLSRSFTSLSSIVSLGSPETYSDFATSPCSADGMQHEPHGCAGLEAELSCGKPLVSSIE